MSSSTLPPPPSEKEAKFYYAGLPSGPVLVARTYTTPWKAPTGPEAYRVIKELRTVGNHALNEVWEDNLALKLHALLDSMKVKWTSTDVVRIGVAKEADAHVVLWIGVVPASLSGDDGVAVAYECRELLREYSIADVDVEIRESVVSRSVGPKLLASTHFFDPIVDVREPLTTTLGLPISTQSTPWAEGTGGFFITESGKSERLLLVTARHVVFTSGQNKFFEHKNDNQARHNVTLFGDAGFHKYLESIQKEIKSEAIMTDFYERSLTEIEGEDDPEANRRHEMARDGLDKAKKAVEELNPFYQNVSTDWAPQESRVLGHVVLSPPISISSEGYTEDWAVIEIDASKVDKTNFKGNAIDLGTRLPIPEVILMLSPNLQNAQFKYPGDRLLRIQGIIPDDEMRHPTTLNQNGDPCLMVIKRGGATGLTIGRADDVCSYARIYHDNGNAETSKEWVILPFDSRSGAFSAKGDSGSVVVDGLGRIGGLLTGGAGSTSSLDLSYATPISFLLKRMQDHGLREVNINPVLT
ncbi:hypothetical protein VKT23_014258 [Stygiomarasmius scandens]|uniref:Serine protease n=1 Tax=Marasmiellus scandens TaxID=2682957 RepID=A0ABR1J4A3_9AGAR